MRGRETEERVIDEGGHGNGMKDGRLIGQSQAGEAQRGRLEPGPILELASTKPLRRAGQHARGHLGARAATLVLMKTKRGRAESDSASQAENISRRKR